MLMSLAYVEHPVYQNGFFTSLRIQYLDFVHIVIDFGILKTLQSLKFSFKEFDLSFHCTRFCAFLSNTVYIYF